MRTKFIKFLGIAIVMLAFCSTAMLAQSSTPRLFYSDLESGPNTGGQNNNGAFVTLWGKGFGASQGSSSVTVGGGAVAGYPLWTDSKIIVQLGAGAVTGNIVVKAGSAASNEVPFTVRAGNIFFVSTSGNDANAGTFAVPWRSSVRVMPPNPPVKGYRCPSEIRCGYMALLPDGDALPRALSLPSAKLRLSPRRSR